MRDNNRPFDEQGKLIGESRRVFCPCLQGKLLKVVPHGSDVACGELMGGMLGRGELCAGIDKGAAREALLMEPLAEGIEEDEKPVVGGAGKRCDALLEPGHPLLVPALQHGEHEVLLGGKVLIEGHLGHTGDFDHPVNPCGMNAALIEEPKSGIQNSLTHKTILPDRGTIRFCGMYTERSVLNTKEKTTMSRLTARDPAQTTGTAKTLLDTVQRSLGMTPNLMRTLAQAPAALEGYLSLNGALAKGTLSPQLRELLAIAIAEANRCEYCLSAHTLLGRLAKVDAPELDAARHGESADPKTQAALAFALAVLTQRGNVTDSDLDAVLEAGYTQGEVAEIVGHVSLNVFTNYFNNVAQTEVDFPRVELH